MMVIKPKTRGFICVNAHPKGCKLNVKNQINYIKKTFNNNDFNSCKSIKNVLIIGGSTGYGLSSRIFTAFGLNAKTLNVCFEKTPTTGKTGTAGWYNTVALEDFARQENLYAQTINADAFLTETKEKVVEIIKKDMGKIDLLIYSLAAPKRKDPFNKDIIYSSILKPIGKNITQKTVNTKTNIVEEISINSATEQEIHDTIKVMGGEDWKLWIDLLKEHQLINQNMLTLAYSYIGSKNTDAVYRKGTIGKAKENLEKVAQELTKSNKNQTNLQAFVSVNKALVTQASSAIPILPLYISLLYKVMKKKNIHENTIMQIKRMFATKILNQANGVPLVDKNGLIRLDDLELRDDVQTEISNNWEKVSSENIEELTDIISYKKEFLNLFGFELDEINYNDPVEEIVENNIL